MTLTIQCLAFCSIGPRSDSQSAGVSWLYVALLVHSTLNLLRYLWITNAFFLSLPMCVYPRTTQNMYYFIGTPMVIFSIRKTRICLFNILGNRSWFHCSYKSTFSNPSESRLLAEQPYYCPPKSSCITAFLSSKVKFLGRQASPHGESGINIMSAYISCLQVLSVHAKRARINT